MKQIFIIPLVVLLNVAVLAQPTLTSESFYSPGDFVLAYDVSTENLNDGSDGANQTWDFSHLETIQESSRWGGSVVDPASIDDFDFYAEANVAMVLNNGTIRYWNRNDDQLNAIGQGGDHDLLHLNNPNVLLEFPFTMGSAFSDEASGTLYSTCRTYDWQSTSETQAVAYGTLVLPSGTFENVLKVRRISFTSKTETEHGFEKENNIVEHYWFQPGTAGPLFYMRSWSNNGCPGSNEGMEAFYTVHDNFSTGTDDLHHDSMSMNIFPNPASGKTHLSIRTEKDVVGQIWISDMLGQNVLKVNERANINKNHLCNIDLSGLQPGLYVLNLRTDGVHKSQKLIVQ